jgi:hypothetical protein
MERVRENANEGATLRLCYDSRLERILRLATATDNTHESTTLQWRLHKWFRRLNRHLEMVHTVSEYTARLTALSPPYPNEANTTGYRHLNILDLLKQ